MRRLLCFTIFLLLICGYSCGVAVAAETIIVSAEGLADPEADLYRKDKGLLLDDLRTDARRQVIEKAVGTMVDSSSLVENYLLVRDRVLTRSQGLIKRVIKESQPWRGEDGFMHLLLKAEVYLSDIRDSLKELSRSGRSDLIKQQGNPRIEVRIDVRDAGREGANHSERSFIAENLLKEHFSKFGYRVWSEGESGVSSADFSVRGEARFKTISARLQASGLTITKHVLTSWSVKCVNLKTRQEIYFNNQIPKGKSWSDEDAALADIGALIGQEFSEDFFSEHLMEPSKIFTLQVHGLPDYDMAMQLKKEFIGLRHVLNVDFREFNAAGDSLFEIDFSGDRDNFMAAVSAALIDPLNQKLGSKVFSLRSARGSVANVEYVAALPQQQVASAFDGKLPAALFTAAPERLGDLIKDESTREKLRDINPQAIAALESASTGTTSGHSQVQDF